MKRRGFFGAMAAALVAPVVKGPGVLGPAMFNGVEFPATMRLVDPPGPKMPITAYADGRPYLAEPVFIPADRFLRALRRGQ